MLRYSTCKLGASLTKSTLKRNFGSSVKRNGGHGHHHNPEISSTEEHLLKNTNYIAVFGGIIISSALVFFDDSYKNRTGKSFFAQFINPVSVEQNDKETIQYDEIIQKDKDFYDAAMIVPYRGPFRDVAGVQIIRRGSPFNTEPNSSIDIDAIGPRRTRRSIFD